MMNKNKAAKEGRTELQLGPNRGLTGRRHQSKDSELELAEQTGSGWGSRGSRAPVREHLSCKPCWRFLSLSYKQWKAIEPFLLVVVVVFMVFMGMAGDVFRFCVGKGGCGYNVMDWGRGDRFKVERRGSSQDKMMVTWAKLVTVMGREIRGKINRTWYVCALITFKLPWV